MDKLKGLKYLRVSHGLTQTQVADHLGVTQSHYAKVESGRSQPRTLALIKLAKLFGVKVDALL